MRYAAIAVLATAGLIGCGGGVTESVTLRDAAGTWVPMLIRVDSCYGADSALVSVTGPGAEEHTYPMTVPTDYSAGVAMIGVTGHSYRVTVRAIQDSAVTLDTVFVVREKEIFVTLGC